MLKSLKLNHNYNQSYKLSPYLYLTKKYFFKKKKIKYKNFKRIFTINVYCELFKHKFYSINYHINLLKMLHNRKITKFNAYQFYFFNFSGLLKQLLIKETLMYSIYWRRVRRSRNIILRGDSYYYVKYMPNIMSEFVLSNKSKYSIRLHQPDKSTRMNYYKNNLLKVEKNEYLKLFNYGNIFQAKINNFIYEKYLNRKELNIYYLRWWNGLWTNNLLPSLSKIKRKNLIFKALNFAIINRFVNKKLYSNFILLYLLFQVYYMQSNSHNNRKLKRFFKTNQLIERGGKYKFQIK